MSDLRQWEDWEVLSELEILKERRTLHLGCGIRPMDGAVNHDRWQHHEGIDIAFDLNVSRWPIPDARFARIVALDVFEHLGVEIDVWLRECWRILEDDGEIVLRVAAWNNPVSYRDPTHKKVFHEETFCFFDPEHELWRNYGSFYYPDGPWFKVVTVERGNADPRAPTRGDICAVLKKVSKPS